MLKYENFYYLIQLKNFIIVIRNHYDLNFLYNSSIYFILIIIWLINRKVLNTDITKLVNQDYQYAFSTNIERKMLLKRIEWKHC
jgi:hypothetical protein